MRAPVWVGIPFLPLPTDSQRLKENVEFLVIPERERAARGVSATHPYPAC